MKYQRIAAILTMIIVVMAMPQNLVAKDKKVKYLGHQYKGAVGNKKVPAGNGVMNVGELKIEGFFDDHSATDAEVCKTSKWIDSPNAWFRGTITYDDSDNIVLKAGGTISIRYYSSEYDVKNGEAKFLKETLKEDRIVNSNTFEPQSIKMPYTFKPMVLLNPAPYFTTYYTLTLKEYEYTKKEKNWDGSSYERTVFVVTFFDLSENEKREKKLEVVTNYKDEEGRIWNYKNDYENPTECSVKYPDGSCYTEKGMEKSAEIHYPDGMVVKEKNGDLDLGNNFFIYMGKTGITYNFIKYKNMPSFKFLNNSSVYQVSSNYYDFDTLSSSEADKIVQEKLLPFFTLNDELHIEFLNHDKTTIVGRIKNGKYSSDKEVKAAQIAKEEKEAKAEMAYWTKRFGFNPSSLTITQLIKVGRTYSTVRDYLKDYNFKGYTCRFSFVEDNGISVVYRIIYGGKRVGYIYVQNDKIITVHWY